MTSNNTLKLWGMAFVSWVIPLAVSFLLFNPNTREYLPNYPVFKIIMAIVLFVVTYWLFMRLHTEMKESKWKVSAVFLVTNIVLDLIVLVGVLAMSLSTWVLTVLPFYVVAFFGVEWYMQTYHLKQPTKNNHK